MNKTKINKKQNQMLTQQLSIYTPTQLEKTTSASTINSDFFDKIGLFTNQVNFNNNFWEQDKNFNEMLQKSFKLDFNDFDFLVEKPTPKQKPVRKIFNIIREIKDPAERKRRRQIALRSKKIVKLRRRPKYEYLSSLDRKYQYLVNSKQIDAIKKRREKRKRYFDKLPIVERELRFKNQTWVHKRRHEHAQRRPRGYRGRFLNKEEIKVWKKEQEQKRLQEEQRKIDQAKLMEQYAKEEKEKEMEEEKVQNEGNLQYQQLQQDNSDFSFGNFEKEFGFLSPHVTRPITPQTSYISNIGKQLSNSDSTTINFFDQGKKIW